MQTQHTTITETEGVYKYTKHISIRRRPGMPGAYMRVRIVLNDGYAAISHDSGWQYGNYQLPMHYKHLTSPLANLPDTSS